MTNIKLVFICIAFVFSSNVFSQGKINPEILKKVDAFISLSNEKKWDEAFDLMYPKLFTKVPKQDLIDLMTSMDQDGMSLQRSNMHLISNSPPLIDGDETFIRLEYTGNLDVKIAKGSLYDDVASIQKMTQQFQLTYGEENVKWDADLKKYTILAHIALMAIQSTNQWYLVEINEDQKELMEFLFSEQVMKKLVSIN